MVSSVSVQNREIRPMMSYQPPPNDPFFSFNVQLETRVRKDHPLRKIKELVDFDFIYKEVDKTYGKNGNVSVPPPVILKLMLLLILYKEYLVSAIQNIETLIRYGRKPTKG